MKAILISMLTFFLSLSMYSQDTMQEEVTSIDTTQRVYYKAHVRGNAVMCPKIGPIAKSNLQTIFPEDIAYHEDYETITFYLAPSNYKSSNYVKYLLNYSGYPEDFITVKVKNTPF